MLLNPYRFGPSGPTDPDFVNRKLLLHFEGTSGTTTFLDSSLSNSTAIVSGDAVLSNLQKRYGDTSLAIEAGYIYFNNTTVFDFYSDDFALEASIYLTGYANNDSGEYQCSVISKDVQSSGRCFSLNLKGTSSSFTSIEANVFYVGGGVVPITVNRSFDFSLNTWYDICFQRNGNLLQMFVNGFKLGSDVTFNQSIPEAVTSLKIGALLYNVAYPYYFKGYIDEVRITKGIAPYNSDYTPGPFLSS